MGLWRGRERWPRVVVALVLCVSVFGCAGAGGPGGADSSASGSGGAVGASSERQSGQSGHAPGAPDAGSNDESNGAAGAPGAAGRQSNGGAQALGAPIKLPAFQQRGQPLYGEGGVRRQIEDAIRAECTPQGDLCVKTEVQPHDPELHVCQFAGTDPDTRDGGTTIPQDKVLIIYSGSNGSDEKADPCPPEASSPDPGTDQQSTDNSAPTDSSPPSTDQAIPPDDSQAPSTTS